jgi:hypothetical protein
MDGVDGGGGAARSARARAMPESRVEPADFFMIEARQISVAIHIIHDFSEVVRMDAAAKPPFATASFTGAAVLPLDHGFEVIWVGEESECSEHAVEFEVEQFTRGAVVAERGDVSGVSEVVWRGRAMEGAGAEFGEAPDFGE